MRVRGFFLCCFLIMTVTFALLGYKPVLAIDTLYEYEYNDEYYYANYMQLNTAYIGNLNSRSDEDYYKFVLDKPGSVLVEMYNNPDLGYSSWRAKLYYETDKGDKEEIDVIEFGSTAYTSMLKNRLSAGTYYLRISYAYSEFTDSDYKFKISYKAEKADSFEQEFNDSYGTANKIKLRNTYTGNLSSRSDVDYYKFTINNTMNLKISFKHTEETGYSKWRLKIYKEDKYGNKEEIGNYMLGASKTENIRLDGYQKGTYYIRINEYSYTNSDYKFTVKENIPGKVSSIKASKITSNSVTLSWSNATDAVKYQIYRATSKNGQYKYITTVTGTKYTDQKLSAKKNYYYKIIAVNSDGYTGSASPVYNVKTK